MTDFDVIIAGAGVAGVAAAAAMRDFGWRVLIVEPGQHMERRLSGELLHPRCVAGLAQLGLASNEFLSEAATIRGVAVLPDSTGEEHAIRLPFERYMNDPTAAMALEQSRLRARLIEALSRFAFVELMEGARVVSADLTDHRSARVVIRSKTASSMLSCRLLIAADGSSSPLRRLAGIPHSRRAVSTLTGYVLGKENLPLPGLGHVFLGGPSPIFAYEIGAGRVRVLLDHPIQRRAVPVDTYRAALIAALPQRLGSELEKTVHTQRSVSFVSCEILVSSAAHGRMALVGDAGGAVHPITATGMTASVSDALGLRQALCEACGDVTIGLRLYARRRRGRQRARVFLARALHEAASGTGISAQTVRDGLVRYLSEDERGRGASMRILTMHDTHMRSILYELLQVILYGVDLRGSTAVRPEWTHLFRHSQLVWSLPATIARHVAASIRAQ